jgi:hypothetical protein
MFKLLYIALLVVLIWTNTKPYFASQNMEGGWYHYHGDQSQYLVEVEGKEIEEEKREVRISRHLYSLRYLNEKNLRILVLFGILGAVAFLYENRKRKNT